MDSNFQNIYFKNIKNYTNVVLINETIKAIN